MSKTHPLADAIAAVAAGAEIAPASSRLLRADQVAKILGISQSGLYALRRAGKGPPFISFGLGRKPAIRYRLSDLEAWIAEHREVRA
jgi:predicted DNA-binding transcriptional regulator AlpA